MTSFTVLFTQVFFDVEGEIVSLQYEFRCAPFILPTDGNVLVGQWCDLNRIVIKNNIPCYSIELNYNNKFVNTFKE